MGRPINEHLPSRRPGEPRPEEKIEELKEETSVKTQLADEPSVEIKEIDSPVITKETSTKKLKKRKDKKL